MEMKKYFLIIFFTLVSCTTSGMNTELLKDLYVDNFHSDDMNSCRPSDVELSHSQARDFFYRAKEVEYRVIHDHYDLAPCYAEGSLNYKEKPCSFKIRAGATGSISCGDTVWYFVCDDCEDLFE